MNEIQIYSVIMFFAGALLSRAVFYFEQNNQKKKFYLIMSAAILQVLDSVHSVHLAAAEYASGQIKKEESVEETEAEEYLQKEDQKVDLFMEIYTLLFIKAVPEEGRKYINYRSWPEAKTLIDKLRGLLNSEEIERWLLENRGQHY